MAIPRCWPGYFQGLPFHMWHTAQPCPYYVGIDATSDLSEPDKMMYKCLVNTLKMLDLT